LNEDYFTNSDAEISKTFQQAADGDYQAIDLLFPLLYDDLHRIACTHFTGERSDHTLQPTAIVHEVYIKLMQKHAIQFQNRSHFLAVSAILMRRILVDHARSKRRSKRGGKITTVAFSDDIVGTSLDLDQMVDLDNALNKLGKLDSRQARIVELRFFGGLSMEEVAETLNMSLRTIEGDWFMARAWLRREFSERSP
jgi:RNA polymerase sigma-70 factor, ECF subfamily